MRKRVIPKRLGTRAMKLLLATSLPVAVQAAYIIYVSVTFRIGNCPLDICEFRELILSEAAALLLSVGGTLLMDLEEKNSERN